MIFDDKMLEAIKAIDAEFWKEYRKIMPQCQSMCEDRQPSYVSDGSIVEYWIHGQDDLAYEINKKNKRLQGLLALEKTRGADGTQKTADSIEDTLIDNINYNAFLLAFRRLLARKRIQLPKGDTSG